MTTTITLQDRIAQIRQLLNDKQDQKALQLLEHMDRKNDLIQNAYSVCLMRVGRVADALALLRALAFKGLPGIAAETPAIIQANYATALLLSGDNLQAIDIINRLKNPEHPYVVKLKQSIEAFKRRSGLWGRLLWALTVYPSKRLDLDFAPGDL